VADPVGFTLAFPYRRRPADSAALAHLCDLFHPV